MAEKSKNTTQSKGKKAPARQPRTKELKIGELDEYLFGMGTHYDIYKKLGAHLTKRRGKEGVYFAVWAPNAKSVSVVGDFNGWDTKKNEMEHLGGIGFWAVFVPGAKLGQLYKFYIVTKNGQELYKADPFANASEFRPGTASKIVDISGFKWSDGDWMEKRVN